MLQLKVYREMILSAIIYSIKKKFPSVKNITTDELSRKLGEDKSKILLLDARKKDEFDVSHIQQAQLLDFKSEKNQIKEFLEANKVNTADVEIVCYCSLGYRSSVLAKNISELLEESKASENIQVYNLEGSIFKWVNENKLLTNQNGETVDYAHPFNYLWGALGLTLSKWKW